MKKLFVVTIFLLITSTKSANAQTATVSATPSPDINRIQEAINKNLNSTEAVLGETNNRLVGYSGTIDDIKEGVLTFESGNTTLQVGLTADTTIIKDGKTIKPELLSVKDKGLVIGNLTGLEVLSAKRIVISTIVEKKIEKKTVFSPIVKINTNSLTINVDNADINLTLGKKLKINLKSLNTNQKIFGVILFSTKGTGTLIQAKVF